MGRTEQDITQDWNNIPRRVTVSSFYMDETCLLYTSDAADERSSVDLGGRRIIKKKRRRKYWGRAYNIIKKTKENLNSDYNTK